MLYILYFSMFQCSLAWGVVRCVHSSQECYIYYTSACSKAPLLGVAYGVFKAHKNVIHIIHQHVPMHPPLGAVYGVFIAHKNFIYIILQHVPMLPPSWSGVRCVHSSQEFYIYYTSACSNAPPLLERCTVCS